MNRKPKYCLQCDDGTEMELAVKDVTVKARDIAGLSDACGRPFTPPAR
ncbi:MAG: hypothetical protein LBT71_06905 [Azoarcus sp.]|jgi:hypothetical protein|nr:hypothetical protein [Azoarcus sp.]